MKITTLVGIYFFLALSCLAQDLQIHNISGEVTAIPIDNIDSIVFLNNEDLFSRDTAGSFTDPRDGEEYKWVKIGDQIWMAENLRATKYSDGSGIPYVPSYENWAAQSSNNSDKAYCWSGNDENQKSLYGAYYTYAAAVNGIPFSGNDNVQGACPSNWHMPSMDEWNALITFLGGSEMAHDKLRDEDNDYWNFTDGNATNASGFNAIPSGSIRFKHEGYGVGDYCVWWSSSEYNDTLSYYNYISPSFISPSREYKEYGFSVRCIKD